MRPCIYMCWLLPTLTFVHIIITTTTGMAAIAPLFADSDRNGLMPHLPIRTGGFRKMNKLSYPLETYYRQDTDTFCRYTLHENYKALPPAPTRVRFPLPLAFVGLYETPMPSARGAHGGRLRVGVGDFESPPFDDLIADRCGYPGPFGQLHG